MQMRKIFNCGHLKSSSVRNGQKIGLTRTFFIHILRAWQEARTAKELALFWNLEATTHFSNLALAASQQLRKCWKNCQKWMLAPSLFSIWNTFMTKSQKKPRTTTKLLLMKFLSSWKTQFQPRKTFEQSSLCLIVAIFTHFNLIINILNHKLSKNGIVGFCGIFGF